MELCIAESSVNLGSVMAAAMTTAMAVNQAVALNKQVLPVSSSSSLLRADASSFFGTQKMNLSKESQSLSRSCSFVRFLSLLFSLT